jgi:hypothetical protein
MTSKYTPLQSFLRDKATSHGEINLSLDQIASIIGVPLPMSAYKHREWWSNQSDVSNRPQAKAWIGAGYKVDTVTQKSMITAIRFVRQ